jgi:hypothetical protein
MVSPALWCHPDTTGATARVAAAFQSCVVMEGEEQGKGKRKKGEDHFPSFVTSLN